MNPENVIDWRGGLLFCEFIMVAMSEDLEKETQPEHSSQDIVHDQDIDGAKAPLVDGKDTGEREGSEEETETPHESLAEFPEADI